MAPVLTRLYTPGDYGLLATFGAIVAVIAAGASGRYSVAAMMPESDREAVQVVALAGLLTLGTSIIVGLTVVAVTAMGSPWGVLGKLGPWALLLPIAIALTSAAEALLYFNLRHDRVGSISRSGVVKAIVAGGSQVGAGAAGLGLGGLVGGFTLGLLVGNLGLARFYLAALGRDARISLGQLRASARRYIAYPKYDLWSTLANTFGLHLTVLGVGAVYSVELVGQYALAYRLSSLPSALVGVAMGQVYLREARLRRSDARLALALFNRTSRLLILLSAVPFLLLTFVGPRLFAAVFGARWEMAGILTAALVPAVWARFVASPISSIFQVYERQRRLLAFQVALSITPALFLAWAHWSSVALQQLLWIQSSTHAVIYLLMWRTARSIVRQGLSPVRSDD